MQAWAIEHANAGRPHYLQFLAAPEPALWSTLVDAYRRDRGSAALTPAPVDPDLVDPLLQGRRSRRDRQEIQRLANEARRRAGRKQHRRAAATGWKAHEGEHDVLTRMRAVDAAARPVLRRGDAIDALLHYGPFRERRSDAQEAIHSLYELLVLSAGEHMTASPGERVATRRLKCHRSTYYEHLAWLIEHRFLGVVCSGLSANYGGRGNKGRRAVYILTTPFIDDHAESASEGLRGALTGLLAAANQTAVAYAAANGLNPLSPTPSTYVDLETSRTISETCGKDESAPLRGTENAAGAVSRRTRHSYRKKPPNLSYKEQQRRPEGCIAISRELKRRVPLLGRMSERAIVTLIAPFVDAGDTAQDLIDRLSSTPDGPWRFFDTHEIKRPAGYVKYRLKHWLTIDKKIIPTGRQQAAEKARLARERQAINTELDRRHREQLDRAFNDPEYSRQYDDAKRKALRAIRASRSRS